MKKNILLTGATGFLGKHVIEYYQNSNVNLILVGRNEDNLKEIKYNKHNFFNVDLVNKIEIEKVFLEKKIDYVIHCAAKSNDWGKYEDFFKNNVLVTKNLIELSNKYNVKRFVHVSSPSIYFNYKNNKEIKESYKNNTPVNYYAKTKLMAEELLLKEYKNNKFSFVGIRPRGIYGEYDQTIFPKLIKLASKSSFPLINKGQALIDVTYVKNVVVAIDLAINANTACLGKFYNITDGTPKKVIDILNTLFLKMNKKIKYRNINYSLISAFAIILERLSLVTKKEPLMTKYSVSTLSFDQTLDVSLAKEELNYQPVYTFEEGIDRFIEWEKK